MEGTKIGEQKIPYKPEDCYLSGRRSGSILSATVKISREYENKIATGSLKEGVLQLFIAKQQQAEDNFMEP